VIKSPHFGLIFEKKRESGYGQVTENREFPVTFFAISINQGFPKKKP